MRKSNPTRSRRPSRCSCSKFIGKPGFPSNGTIPSSWKQFQPRLGRGLGSRRAKAKQWCVWAAESTMRARPAWTSPAPAPPMARSGNPSIAAHSFNGFGVTPPAYTQLVPNAGQSRARSSAGVCHRQELRQSPHLHVDLRRGAGAQQRPEVHVGVHLCQRRAQQPLRGSQRRGVRFPVEHRAGCGWHQRHRAVDDAREFGEVAVPRTDDRHAEALLP